jgi:hypothetical protein
MGVVVEERVMRRSMYTEERPTDERSERFTIDTAQSLYFQAQNRNSIPLKIKVWATSQDTLRLAHVCSQRSCPPPHASHQPRHPRATPCTPRSASPQATIYIVAHQMAHALSVSC